MKKLISALMIGFAICSSVSAMECTSYVDEKGTLDKKCVRDEYDRAGAWSTSQPYDADRQTRKIRVSRHGNTTFVFDSHNPSHTMTCTTNQDGSVTDCH